MFRYFFTYIMLFNIMVTLSNCKKQSKMEARVVGGGYTTISKYPFAVYLAIRCVLTPPKEEEPESRAGAQDVVRDAVEEYYSCGATILNSRTFLTAAHCLKGCSGSSQLMVSIGSTNKFEGSIYGIKLFIVHPKYETIDYTHDIGLAAIDASLHKINFGVNVGRVALLRDPPYREKAMVFGRGLNDEVHNTTDGGLKEITQYVWDKQKCIDVVQVLPNDTFCASSDNKLEYASDGDSGGGLIVRDYIIIGIVSFKVPEVDKSMVVYTDVGKHYDWIVGNVERIYCGAARAHSSI